MVVLVLVLVVLVLVVVVVVVEEVECVCMYVCVCVCVCVRERESEWVSETSWQTNEVYLSQNAQTRSGATHSPVQWISGVIWLFLRG